MDNTLFWKTFNRRSGICFFIVILLFFISILRVAVTATADYTQTQMSNKRLKLTISKQRGTIFDCNMIKITNNKKKIIAAVSPTPRAITAISTILEGDELNNVLETLKSGKPVLCEVKKTIECDGIVYTEVYEHTNNNTIAPHIVGYTNIDMQGVSGIELAYDDLLYSKNEITVSYECDGKGNILEGIYPIIKNETSVESNGVVSTIDINIQKIAQRAAKNIESGAVIVADAKTGKIRASVSRPDFEIENISEYLNAENSPLLNRAINAYNVGSVFKPCVLIAGFKRGKNSFCYECLGSCEITDRIFKCHKYDGHGLMNSQTAIANSCNTYFYNFAFNIGKEEIYKTASVLRFGKKLKLCNGIYTASGNIPILEKLKNPAHLANFSIGQGELLLSPISILPLYCAIASNGYYYIPSLVEGTISNGSFNKYDIGNPTQVMSEETAKTIRQYLSTVLTEGTGEKATPKTVTAAGKTATAQTGKFINGIEICQGWFCGFFPLEEPKYVVVVFSEDTKKQKISCAEIFAQIADEVNHYELK